MQEAGGGGGSPVMRNHQEYRSPSLPMPRGKWLWTALLGLFLQRLRWGWGRGTEKIARESPSRQHTP